MMKYIAIATLSVLLGASSRSASLGPHEVTLETADGIQIHGWYIHPGSHEVVEEEDNAFFAEYSAVVLLHM